MAHSTPLLQVRQLVTSFGSEGTRVRVLDEVSLDLQRGQTLGLVGESGCGKSVTVLSILRLLPKPAGRIESGRILFEGQDLAQIPVEQMQQIRGNRISMIFQEPMTALNPVHKVGRQIAETYQLHKPQMSHAEILRASVELLYKVGIASPEQRINEFPHQLSGGMRQRVMIAMALACEPDILIADEPTTALDVTIQAQILSLIQRLQEKNGMAVIFITHDLGVIAQMCDDVIVMYAGRMVEQASAQTLFNAPKHPYTQGLLESIPHLETTPKTRLNTVTGSVPGLHQLPMGCRFHNRCPRTVTRCTQTRPPLEQIADHHRVACFRWREPAVD